MPLRADPEMPVGMTGLLRQHPGIMPPFVSAKVTSASVRKWNLNTERQGAT
jgi:hypothetical protein